ncbi:hypothetical protein, partial [Ruegeria sp.]|uniref:hypothetical protein n=1 Tax=Ruegeria sp. TaxID=1879320 RepID=UPI00231DB201
LLDNVKVQEILAFRDSDVLETPNADVTATLVEDLGADLIVNGSFEAGAETRPDASITFGTPDGWTIVSGTQAEFLTNGVDGLATESGSTFLELAVNGIRSSISQDVATNGNGTYQISIDYRTHSGLSGDNLAVEVLWNGEVVGVITEGSQTEWTTHTFRVSGAPDGNSTIELRDASTNGGQGGLLDNVRVQEVQLRPDPNYDAADAAVFTGQLLLNDAGVNSLAQAEQLLATKQSEIIDYNASRISFAEQSGSVFEFFDTAAYAEGLYEDRVHDNAIHKLNGQIYLSAGQHTVDLEHDDGVRLSIAGQQVITDDYWDGTQTKTATFSIAESGYYDVDLLFFEGGGHSRLNLAIDGQVVDTANQNFVAPEYRTVAGNEIEAFGTANFVVAGDGDDRIRAGSLLNLATAAAVQAANNSDDSFVRGAFGTSDGTLYGEESLGTAFTNLVGAIANLGNVIIAGNGNNIVKAYGGANIIQTGSGDDQITAYGLGNAIVAGNGNNSLQLIGASNFVWGGDGDDEIQFIGDDNIYVLGDGYNRVTGFGVGGIANVPGVGNIGNIIIGAGGVDDVVVLGARNFLILGGGDNFAIAIGNVNVLQGASGDDFFVGLGANNVVNAGDGDNFLVLGGLLNLVFTGAGNDVAFQIGTDNYGFYGGGDNRVFLGGERNIVLTGTGDDTVIAVAIPTVSLVIQAITGVELPTGNIAITGAGRDNVILLGKANIALTGADHDITILGGEYNFLLSGAGDDISLLAGKYNFAFFEGGDDIGITLGETNVVFSGSGDDILGVIGKTNVVFAGSGSDLLLVAGEFNFVVTDNEIEFSTAELASYLGEGDFNPASDLKIEGGDTGIEAGAFPYADLAFFFPDIEFSNPDVPDYSFPTLTSPQVDIPIPDIPELKSAPEYKYGELGNYGFPTISLPTLSIPELQLPGQSIPSIAIPDITQFNLAVEGAGVQTTGSFNIQNDFYGGGDAFARDFLGTNSSDGAPGTLFGNDFDATFYLLGEDYGVTAYAQTENNLGVGDVDQLLDVNASNSGVESLDQGTLNANLQGNYNLLDAEARTENELTVNKAGVTYDYSVEFSAGSIVEQSISGQVAVPFGGIVDPTHNTISIGNQDTGAALDLTDKRTYEVQITYEAAQLTGNGADDIIVYYHGDNGTEEIGRIDPTVAGSEQTATFLFRAEEGGELRFESESGGAPLTQIAAVDVVESDVSRIDLPTFSLPDLELPEFHLNGLDLSGLDVLDDTIAGREFFGLQIPDFDIPGEDLVVPDFDLQDHVNTDEVRLDSLSYTIPSFNIPNIAGIQWDQRIGDYSHEYSLLQSQLVEAEQNLVELNPLEGPTEETVYGDLAVVVGKENHVYAGRGDDAALLAGQKNFFYGGSDDDIGILVGETNLGLFDRGNDIALAIGKTNTIDLKNGTDLGIAIGEK